MKTRIHFSLALIAIVLTFEENEARGAVLSYYQEKSADIPQLPFIVNPVPPPIFTRILVGTEGSQYATYTKKDGTICTDHDQFSSLVDLSKLGTHSDDSTAEGCSPDAWGWSLAEGSAGNVGAFINLTEKVVGVAVAWAGGDVVAAQADAYSRTVITAQNGRFVPTRGQFVPVGNAFQFKLTGQTGNATAPIAGSGRSSVHDPITLSMFDWATGEVLAAGDIFSMDASLELGTRDSVFEWNSVAGLVSVDAEVADFSISIDDDLIVNGGTLSFSIRGGVVVQSRTTGVFDGLLPEVGSSGTFSFPLGEIPLELDLSNSLFDGRELGLNLDASENGTAFAQEVNTVPDGTDGTMVLLGISSQCLLFFRKRRSMDQFADE